MKNSKIFNVLVTVVHWVNRVPYGRCPCVNVVRRRTAESAEKDMDAKKLALSNEPRTLQAQYASGIYDLGHSEAQYEEFDKVSWYGQTCNGFHLRRSCGDIAGEKIMKFMEKDMITKKLITSSICDLEHLIYHQYEMNTLQTLWGMYVLQRKIKEVTHEKL